MNPVRSMSILALALVARSAPCAPGVRGESTLPGSMAPGQALEYLLGVITVMAALAAFVFVMRRVQQRQGLGGSQLRVRASLPLGGKERLLLVEAEGERLLLGVSPGGVQLVRRLRASEAQDHVPVTAQRGNWLSRTLNAQESG